MTLTGKAMTNAAARASMTCMPPMHRTQICIDDERFERVAAIAQLRGSSIAAVIRDAIDLAFAADPERARAAARRVLADDVLSGRETTLRW